LELLLFSLGQWLLLEWLQRLKDGRVAASGC
jgi:hypothetical protein